MFCNHCGAANADTNAVCQQCGQPISPVAPPAPDSPMPSVSRTMPSVELPPPPGLPQNGLPQGQLPQQWPQPQTTSGLAIASLVCSLLCIPINIAGIICGHLALGEIKRSAGRIGGRGLAIAGLVIGYIQIAFIPFILIIAAIAIPNLLRSRIAANEASAVHSVRSINTAQMAWQNEKGGFTCSLPQLGPARVPGAPEDAVGYLDSQLSSGTKAGYHFSLRGCDPDLPNEPVRRYIVIAEPVTHNTSGVRAFCSDETGVIKIADDGLASTCLESGRPLM